MIARFDEITARQGRRVYSTYHGFRNGMNTLIRMELVTGYMCFGTYYYQLTEKGRRFINRYG